MAVDIINDTQKITQSIYHTEQDSPTPRLVKILADLFEYCSTPNNPLTQLPIFETALQEQLKEDNRDSQPFTEAMINWLTLILDTKPHYDLEQLQPELHNLCRMVQIVTTQYRAFLLYRDQHQIVTLAQVTSEDPEQLQPYRTFLQQVTAPDGYIESLFASQQAIKKLNSPLLLLGYNFFLQMDYRAITEATAIKELVRNMVAIQNQRRYPDREQAIILIGDCISAINSIIISWFILNIEKAILELDYRDNTELYQRLIDLISRFLATEDPTLLPDLEDILTEVTESVDATTEKSELISNLTQATQQVASSGIQKTKIETMIEKLDNTNAMLDGVYQSLSNLKIKPNYDALQNTLNAVTKLVSKLDGIIKLGTLNKAIHHINKVIQVANKALASVNKSLCIIFKSLCIVSGYINFMDTFVKPQIEQLKKLVNQVTSTITDFIDAYLNLGNTLMQAISSIVYTALELKLLSKEYEIGVAMKLSTAPGWSENYRRAVNNVVTAMGGRSSSSIDKLRNQIRATIEEVERQFKDALKPENGANCPPIELMKLNFSIPNFSLLGPIVGLENINLQVRC